MITPAAQCPQSMHCSRDFSCKSCERKPATNASPAPLVSTRLSTFVTGKD